jgi:hypothetical protein
VSKLKRAHANAEGDVLLRIELAEQLNAAVAAEAELRAVRSGTAPEGRP